MLVPMRRSISVLGLALAVMLGPWLPTGITATPVLAAVFVQPRGHHAWRP